MVDNYWNPDGRGIRHMGNGKIINHILRLLICALSIDVYKRQEMYTRFVPGVHIGSSGRSSFFIIRVPAIRPTEQMRRSAAMMPGQSPGPGSPVP